MRQIRTTKAIFDKLKNAESTQTFMSILFNQFPDERLFGGLDHVSYYQDSIEVYDRGCNGKSNDFEIVY